MTEQNQNNNKLIVREIGKISFVWQELWATRLIREKYGGKRRATAIAIYQSLTECANEHSIQLSETTSIFPAFLIHIGELAKKHPSTVKRYVNEFKEMKILTWKCEREGKINKANLWILLTNPLHNGEPISPHNSVPNALARYYELVKKYKEKEFMYNKAKSIKWKRGTGAKSIGDILNTTQKYDQ